MTRQALRVCVIGAGSSGIVAAKLLADRGLPVEGYEIGSDIGGIWRYQNDSGRSPAYASLQTNTSKHRTTYRCYPTRAKRDFVANGELLEYFDEFADRFDVRRLFRFRTEVTGLARDGEGYVVTARGDTGETTRRYRAVVVAAGHHWDAKLPGFAAGFPGTVIHSREYRTPSDPVSIGGKRVMVVGIGNSGCDITCEIARVADRTIMSTRRSAHVLPKYLLGRPIDQWVTPLSSRLSVDAQARLLAFLVNRSRGDQRGFGIRRPEHRLGHEHPTLSQDLPHLVRDGLVTMRPDVESVEPSSSGTAAAVYFVDGSSEEVDVVVCATGYHVSFPYMDADLLDLVDPRGAPERAKGDGAGNSASRANGRVPGNRIGLYRHVVAPNCPGLFFLGLVQPLGAIPPLAEAQAEWVADLITGEGELPTVPEMMKFVEGAGLELARRFVASSRHTLEVDFFPYLRLIARERTASRRRAVLSRAASATAAPG